MENGVQEHDKVSADRHEGKQNCKLIICQRQATRHATLNQPNVRTGFILFFSLWFYFQLLTDPGSLQNQAHLLSPSSVMDSQGGKLLLVDKLLPVLYLCGFTDCC